mgnify:CR=1 FL=1
MNTTSSSPPGCLGTYHDLFSVSIACLCGAVKVEIRGGISDIIHCHCSLCRKSSGTAYATNGFVLSAEFSVIQGKELLKKYGVAVLDGGVAFTPDEAVAAAEKLGGPVYVVKSQIHAGGRGKGSFKEAAAGDKGGVRLTKSVAEAAEQASRCSQCGVPYCQSHCPLHNNIPDWLRLTAEGRLQEAYNLSQATNTFPEICGRYIGQRGKGTNTPTVFKFTAHRQCGTIVARQIPPDIHLAVKTIPHIPIPRDMARRDTVVLQPK